MSLAEALAPLSREERALAVIAATLAGRDAPRLCARYRTPRADALARATEAPFEMAPRARLAALSSEAARLAKAPRPSLDALHPTRRVALVAELGEARALLTAADTSSSAHPCALAAVAALLDERVAPAPFAQEWALAPAIVRELARRDFERLERAADKLGASALRALLDGSPPAVADWLAQRLPEAWDERLRDAVAVPLEPLLAALAADPRPPSEEGEP